MITTDQFSEKLDMLKLYFNDEFPITDKITVHKPSIQDIIDYGNGEDDFFFMLHIFIGNTTYYRVALWDNGIDWNELTDFQMWSSMVMDLDPSKTSILFGDLDFTKFKPYNITRPKSEEESKSENEDNEETTEFILYDEENDIEINEITYFRFRNYLRYMFNIFPKIQTDIKGKRIKEEIIRSERIRIKRESENKSGSFLYPMISFCLNHPGFKYRKNELREMGIVEFMDSVYRLQTYERCRATLQGMMSGFVDGSKIKVEQYDFMKDLIVKQKDISEEIKDATNSPTNYNDAMKEIIRKDK